MDTPRGVRSVRARSVLRAGIADATDDYPIPHRMIITTCTAEQLLATARRQSWLAGLTPHRARRRQRRYQFWKCIYAREGSADYYLMVADVVTWAKSEGIAVGPGRGSAAGWLVWYLLHITEIDSMQFPMLFERFLDPTRTDLPDIDIDFEDDRRDEVFACAATKYVQEYVANIGTFTSTPISASQR
jgi:DNA polymerase-3 subunit alpha